MTTQLDIFDNLNEIKIIIKKNKKINNFDKSKNNDKLDTYIKKEKINKIKSNLLDTDNSYKFELEKNIDEDKIFIIELFKKNIQGKKIELENYNNKHCGKEGYWLEKQMNIKHNSKNEPDIRGYEMKKDSKK
jgi:hypothetical protein